MSSADVAKHSLFVLTANSRSLADLLHLRRVREMVEPTGHGWSKEREMIRFVLCYGIFFIWAICFIALYISVRQKALRSERCRELTSSPHGRLLRTSS